MTNHMNNFNNRFEREHNGRDMKLQDVFLNHCRREKTQVSVQHLDGNSKKGYIIGFDSQSIILEEDGRQHLLYKSAIVAVNPLCQVNYIFNESSRSEFYGHFNENQTDRIPQFADVRN